VLSFKFLVLFSLLTGIFAQECTMDDLGVADFADKVTVTNTSQTAGAFVAVKFNHGQVTMYVQAGKSRTAIALASTKYTAKVTNPGSGEYGTYKDSLLELRSQLLDISISSHASDNVVAQAWTELTFVQAALDQMTGSNKVQSCSGTLKQEVASQVIVEWRQPLEGQPLWVLDCN
jgi:hypothetical protein